MCVKLFTIWCNQECESVLTARRSEEISWHSWLLTPEARPTHQGPVAVPGLNRAQPSQVVATRPFIR